MKPLEFVLWLNGATGMLGETPPSAEQWQLIRENLVGTIGPLVAAKFLERADTLFNDEAERAKLMQQYVAQQQAAGQLSLQRLAPSSYSTSIWSSARGF